MAISEQEEFEFRRRAEAERGGAAPAPTAKKPATFLSTLGRAAWNLPADALETANNVVESAYHLPGNAINAALHPGQTAAAVGGVVDNAAHILSGGVQRMREAYPADQQGSAPKMDTAAYDKFAADNYQKYGTKQNLYKTIGDHPLAPAVAIASILSPVAKATGVSDAIGSAVPAAVQRIAPGAAKAVSNVTAPLKAITQAERRATATASQMQDEIAAELNAGQSTASSQASQAAQQAARATSLANQARAQGRVLNDRRAAASAASAQPELAIGDPRHLSDIGDSIRNPAIANQDALTASMREADTKYRTAMEQVAADRAASGVGVSDTPTAKILIKQSKAIVDPNPVSRPSVGSVPADSAGGKLHSMLLDVLQPKEVPLTVNEARKATQAGIKVNVAPDGSMSRTIKPDLKSVDDFRRFLGKVLDGKIEGYEAVNRIEAGNMYGNVSKVIDQYVKGASKPVQQNWAAGKAALEPFEKVRAGQAVVGTQGGTDVASVPAANIPGRVISGGRDTLKQTAAVAGDAPVAATLRSQVQNTLAGAKTADAAQALIRPGTKLGDAVNTDSGLASDVADYIQRLRASEASATQATALARRATTATGRAAGLDKAATYLQSSAVKAADTARDYERRMASLNLAEPKQVGTQYIAMLNDAHRAGKITTEQYSNGLTLAARAEKDFALKATRDKWMRRAAYIAGIGAAPVLGADVVHALGR